MKKTAFLIILFTTLFHSSRSQFNVGYNPALQPTEHLQYFAPVEGNLFVGDCIPFYHKGTYYLYWLIDKDHHASLNGLGGHQWVLSTSTDLIHWKHHPVVLGIDEEWEKSICTGSLVYKNNLFYAFYATRFIKDGQTKEQMSYAISKDGINFKKQMPNPFYGSAAGYSPSNFRDPKVIVDSNGTFNLLISTAESNAPVANNAGCLVRLTSKDLKNWEIFPPVLSGQKDVPECPDYFYWNGWYYLIYSTHGDTYYVKSKGKYGPWQYPSNQCLKEQFSNVAKTAEFGNGRRIAASWIPARKDNKDNEVEMFGGNLLFREIIQLEDGSLGTSFPKELIPETKSPISTNIYKGNTDIIAGQNSVELVSDNGLSTAHLENVPTNCRITLEVEIAVEPEEFGLFLRSDATAKSAYKLNISPYLSTVSLANTSIYAVEGLNKNITLDIIMKDDIIDVCIGNKRCIVNRLPEHKGKFLWLYSKLGALKYKNIQIAELK